jgi:hypothetical protein
MDWNFLKIVFNKHSLDQNCHLQNHEGCIRSVLDISHIGKIPFQAQLIASTWLEFLKLP